MSCTEFKVLGELAVGNCGERLQLGANRQRVLLAALLLQANQTVSVDELIDQLWDDTRPARARAVVQKYIMRLRRLLADGSIRTDDEGYHIEIGPDQLDLIRFEQLSDDAADAAEEGDSERELVALAEALRLWDRTPPLSNVQSVALHRHQVRRLMEEYLRVLGRRMELLLHLGRPEEVVVELMELVERHPFHEQFWAQRLRALHGTGRRTEAIRAYHEVRKLLNAKLGVDPGAEIRAAYDEILDDSVAKAGNLLPKAGAGPGVLPRQLPLASAGLAGRRVELETIDDLLSAAPRSGPIVVITGPPGVGKTMVAIQAAHRAAEWFADGQLYVDLHAHAEVEQLEPKDVLSSLLRVLGMPPHQIPALYRDQVAAYRMVLARKQVLIVLDNVGTADQVRALLPYSSCCAVVITSRNELTDLALPSGKHRIVLAVHEADEAVELLVATLGRQRVASEGEAAKHLVELCGGLALALRIAAVRLAVRPEKSIAEFVAQLERSDPVTLLSVEGDQQTSLAAVFDRSYRSLDPAEQRLLWLLSITQESAIDVRLAATLMATDLPLALVLLERLASASLLTRIGGERYQLHKLIRGYAAQLHQPERVSPPHVRPDGVGQG